jgi:hypothetical protein
MRIAGAVIILVLLSGGLAHATTYNAASCSNTDVQAAINLAVDGDTVTVPAGGCTWTSIAIVHAIIFQGAGSGALTVTLNSNPSFTITKQTGGMVKVQGFTFTASNNNNLPHPIVVQGPWPTGQPVLFAHNAFVLNGASMMDILVAGGVILSHNTFNGLWNDFLLTVKDLTNTTSWTTADSLGSHDTNGLLNVYIEDNTFNGGSNGVFDCDDNCRMVVRHNTFIESGGFNSHGEDTSPYGMRQFEIYNNSFTFPDQTCAGGQTSLSNINQYIWIRGATGVVFSNSMDDLQSTCWGPKPEVRMSIRGAEDVRPQGACNQVTYPVPHQLGQSNNGSSDFTDPIYFWSNTGTIEITPDWGFGNPCGFTFSTFFQWGRDGINSAGTGGSAKSGYTSYTYPHPLVDASVLTAPALLRVLP